MKLVVYSFSVGFAARLLQLSLQALSMVGSTSSFEPYGDIWCLLSSCMYGVICLLVALAGKGCVHRSSTTIAALLLAGILLLADFAKPSRFEDGTYVDHAIHTIGMAQANVSNFNVSTAAKRFHSLAKL